MRDIEQGDIGGRDIGGKYTREIYEGDISGSYRKEIEEGDIGGI